MEKTRLEIPIDKVEVVHDAFGTGLKVNDGLYTFYHLPDDNNPPKEEVGGVND